MPRPITAILHSWRIHFSIWWIVAKNALQEAFVNRATNSLFFFGKALRLVMMLIFLFTLKNTIPSFAGYSIDQMFVFFLTYQVIDISAQIFYRGVYLFSEQVRTGEFDFVLAKPINPLFRALAGKPDINETLFFIPNLVVIVWLALSLDLHMTVSSIMWYLVLMANSFLIVTALHIMVLVIGILTTEVDGVIWMYRDLIRLGQFPVTIYTPIVRFSLFFLIPIGLMITIPAQVLLTMPPAHSMAFTLLFGLAFFVTSLRLWNWALKHYSSASS